MRRVFCWIVILLLTACAQFGTPARPQVALAGVMVEEMSLFEQRFQLILRVSNPNDVELPVNGVEFKLELNGEPFASGESHEPVILPRKGSALVKLKVKTSLSGLWRQIQTLQKGDKPLGYRIIGTLYTPWLPGGVPFERKGELPGLNRLLPESPGKVEKL